MIPFGIKNKYEQIKKKFDLLGCCEIVSQINMFKMCDYIP